MAGKRLVVMAVLAAVATMVTTATSSGAPKPQTISLLEVDYPIVGIGGFPTEFNEPPSVGQGFVVRGMLYKWAGTKRVRQSGTSVPSARSRV